MAFFYYALIPFLHHFQLFINYCPTDELSFFKKSGLLDSNLILVLQPRFSVSGQQ